MLRYLKCCQHIVLRHIPNNQRFFTTHFGSNGSRKRHSFSLEGNDFKYLQHTAPCNGSMYNTPNYQPPPLKPNSRLWYDDKINKTTSYTAQDYAQINRGAIEIKAIIIGFTSNRNQSYNVTLGFGTLISRDSAYSIAVLIDTANRVKIHNYTLKNV